MFSFIRFRVRINFTSEHKKSPMEQKYKQPKSGDVMRIISFRTHNFRSKKTSAVFCRVSPFVAPMASSSPFLPPLHCVHTVCVFVCVVLGICFCACSYACVHICVCQSAQHDIKTNSITVSWPTAS